MTLSLKDNMKKKSLTFIKAGITDKAWEFEPDSHSEIHNAFIKGAMWLLSSLIKEE